jgi:protein SCO1/2
MAKQFPGHARRRHTLALAAAVLALCGCDDLFHGYNGNEIGAGAAGLDFHLLGAAGRATSMADFRGKYVLLFFGFTQCPDICPSALSRAVETRRLLGAAGRHLQVVFITIDPERDSPELLEQYTAAFDPSFVGLAGTAAQTARVAADFKIEYRKVASGNSYSMDHTSTSYLFDRGGRIRLAIAHKATAQQCADDLRRLMRGDGDRL